MVSAFRYMRYFRLAAIPPPRSGHLSNFASLPPASPSASAAQQLDGQNKCGLGRLLRRLVGTYRIAGPFSERRSTQYDTRFKECIQAECAIFASDARLLETAEWGERLIRRAIDNDAIVMTLGIPLALASWFGLFTAALLIPVIVWRLL